MLTKFYNWMKKSEKRFKEQTQNAIRILFHYKTQWWDQNWEGDCFAAARKRNSSTILLNAIFLYRKWQNMKNKAWFLHK